MASRKATFWRSSPEKKVGGRLTSGAKDSAVLSPRFSTVVLPA